MNAREIVCASKRELESDKEKDTDDKNRQYTNYSE